MLLCAMVMVYSHATTARPAQKSDTISLWVNGLCGQCESRIEEAALKTRGVKLASWNEETRMLSITREPVKFKEKRLHYNIASAGHDTKELLAPDPVYEALPMCCKYRDFKTHDEANGESPQEPGHDHAGDKETVVSEGTGVTGVVFETGKSGKKTPLPGANVY